MIKILTKRVGLFDKLFLFSNYFKILIHIQIMKKYMKLWHTGCIGSLKCWLISKLNFNMAKILGILPNSNCKKHILYSKQLEDI